MELLKTPRKRTASAPHLNKQEDAQSIQQSQLRRHASLSHLNKSEKFALLTPKHRPTPLSIHPETDTHDLYDTMEQKWVDVMDHDNFNEKFFFFFRVSTTFGGRRGC